MNVNLPVIDNAFRRSTNSTSVQCLTPPETKDIECLSSIPTNRPPSAIITIGNAKTDNTFATAPRTTINKQPQNFSYALHGKIAIKTPQKAKVSVRSEGQSQTTSVTEQPNIVQLWLAQFSQNVSCGKEGVARKIEPKAGHELAQSLTKLRADQSPTAAKQTAKSPGNEVPLAVNQAKIRSKVVLTNTSKGLSNTHNHLVEIKNADETQISSKAALAAKVPTNQQSSQSNKESTTGIFINPDDKTTATGEKPPVIVAKPAVLNGQEIPELNTSFSSIQDKTSKNQSQNVENSPKKTVSINEKPTAGNYGAVRQGKATSRLLDGDGKTQTGNPSSDNILQKLNPAQVQVSATQTKDFRNSTSNGSSNSDSQQIPSTNNAQTLITEQSSTSSATGKAANNTSYSDIARGISQQIQESIQSSLHRPDQQITIRLNPPELGTIFIKFQEQKDRITGLVEVGKIQTRYEVEQALPEIIRNLQDLGVQIKRLEVTQPDQSEHQAYKDQPLQDGWSERHGSAQGNNPENTPADEWLANIDNYQDISELQKALITDNSINMLV